jgi:hypothetical protein
LDYALLGINKGCSISLQTNILKPELIMSMFTRFGCKKGWLTAWMSVFLTGMAVAQWTPVGTDNGVTVAGTGVSGTGCDYHSLAVDQATGTLYTAYQDFSKSNKVAVKKFNGTQWLPIGTEGFSKGAAIYINLVISPSGVPYVLYRDGGPGILGRAVVKKFDGTDWVPVGTEGFTPANSDNARGRLCFDKSGTPYIAYIDYATGIGGKITAMKFDGTNWVVVGTKGFTSGVGSFCDIKTDASGAPLVVYANVANTNKLTVSRFNGTAWAPLGADGFTSAAATNTAMEVDATGNPYVAFSDATRANRLTVMKYDGTAWTTVGAAGFTTDPVANNYVYRVCGIVIDKTGHPVVVFTDGTNGNKTTSMRFNGTDWVVLGATAFSAGNAVKCVDAVLYKSILYTGFLDGTKWEARVMKYTLCNEPGTPVVTADKNKICAGDNTTLRISAGELNDATEWSWYTGSCGGTAAGKGTALAVSPTTATTYYVRAEGGCVAVQPCTPYDITIAPAPAEPSISLVSEGLFSSNTMNNQWYLDGVAINGATQQAYAPAQSGNYTVVVTNSDGCKNTSPVYAAKVGSNVSDDDVYLLPNPVHDYVKVQFTKIVPQVVISIISFEGKKIISDRFTNTQVARFDTRQLQPGVYLVRIFSTDGSVKTLRMVKGK